MKFSLSRKLTAAERASFEKASTDLGNAISAVDQASKTVAAKQKTLEELEAEAVKLEEKAEAGSVDASTALHGVRDQIERIRAAVSDSGAGGRAALFAPVETAGNFLRTIILPDLREQLHVFIKKQNAELFLDPSHAVKLIVLSPLCDAANWLEMQFRVNLETSARVGEAQRFITIIEQALKGGTVWETPPAPAKPKSPR